MVRDWTHGGARLEYAHVLALMHRSCLRPTTIPTPVEIMPLTTAANDV
jgi:hypothetical protein